MTRRQRVDWLAPTLTLCILWLVGIGVVAGFTVFVGLALPGFVARSGPFIIAGLATGRLVSVSRRRPKIIAAAVLALVSAVAWTSFAFATKDISADKALLLFAMSLPVNILGGAWAYFGMFLGGRRRERPATPKGAGMEPELDELERELRREIARERVSGPNP